ncbi:MAG TPA: Lrp/AsnC family transcriptional regulator [Ectothiorhodospiraceae bacterium]|nr:Lrp/AsnC family transcriptional regulator [Ectothiorhodospiraceae bacterium]
MDSLDRAIINELQGGFPICAHPYAEVAENLGTTEDELISRLSKMDQEKIYSRFGPMYHAERMGGGLTLAALQVPDERYDEVTEQVNAFPEVAHNYAREHSLNMWFVLATEKPERIAEVINEIELRTGLHVYNMPKQQEFFIGLKFEV